MAVRANYLTLLAVLALFLTVSAYRFEAPKNLFTRDPVDSSVDPEGVRKISGFENAEETSKPNEFEHAHELHKRVRRLSEDQPATARILESDLSGETRDTLYMSWPGNRISDSNILLLARNKKGPANSIVYLSTNFGKNWTNLNSRLRVFNSKAQAVIDQIYVSESNHKLCILADVTNKHVFITKDFQSFMPYRLLWSPSFVSFHPTNPAYIAGYDRLQKKLYLSLNQGQTFTKIKDNVKTFWWGVKSVDKDSIMFMEIYKSQAKNAQSTVQKYDFISNQTDPLLDNVDEFEVMGNYLFATTTTGGGPGVAKKTKLVVSYKSRTVFQDTRFPAREAYRDFFIYDVQDDQVFVVINHQRNESNLYLSDVGGVKFVLSLERVLYHNPYTDVSSAWLRTVVPYAFVDIHKVKSMRGVYIATQLSPGPVGRRHLMSFITYNKGGSWGRIRSPTRDINGSPIYCYLPSCSLHMNLKYGSVYRISPSENLLSTDSAPGLVMALGVASTNLKIHPDLFISNDGGANWKRALRGKHQYAFGDHGGVIIAVLYRRYTYTLRYSTNGGDNWMSIQFTSPANKVLVQDIFTQTDEKLPVFLLYGSALVKGKKTWKVYHVNMTSVLGDPCTANDTMQWVPHDNRAGMEKCIMGRQVAYQVRNWTRTCYLGKDYQPAKVISNCHCQRNDFECDFGFEQNVSSSVLGCVLEAGEDLDNDIIPDDCKEGTSYNRSSGYRKIPGNTCVGGESKYFLPKLTPCPVKDLVGLSITTSIPTAPLGVKTSTPVTFTAALVKGYLPNINFGWDFGDGIRVNGTGQAAARQVHSFERPGHYVVVLTTTNTRSVLVKRIGIFVEDALLADRVSLSFSPPDPTINQEITFMTTLTNYTRQSAGQVSYKCSIQANVIQQTWQPIFKYTFPKSSDYTVTCEVSNSISTVTKSTVVSVSKDIRPRSVKAVALGATAISVTWDIPLEASLYILGYKIFKSLTAQHGFSEAHAVSGATRTSDVIYHLTPSTRYYFKVMAFMAKGDGAFSEVVSTTTNSSVPGIPQNLRVYPTSATSMKVEWAPPKNTNQRILKYTIHWWSEFDHAIIPVNLDGSVTSREFVKLRPDTLYSFEIFATSAIGPGPPAGPVEAKTNISKPTLAPRNLRVIANNGTCALLSWGAPSFSSSDSRPFPAKGYRVYVDKLQYKTISQTNLWICGFVPGSTHSVAVLAFSVAGDGPRSSKVIALIALKPSSPRNLVAQVISSRIIKLTWQAPVTINGRLLNYAVYQLKPMSWSQPKRVVGTSYEVKNLQPFTKYEFAVAANNSVGLGARSASVAAMTREEIPDAPKYVTAEVISPESATIRIMWSQPTHPNGKITGYMITWGRTDVTDGGEYDQRITHVVGNTMEYTFQHLQPGTEYSFSVGAKNSVGESLTTSSPIKQYTQPAVVGTARLRIGFAGAKDTAGDKFPDEFISAVSVQAQIPDERVAALEIQAAVVLFNVLPRLKTQGKSIEQVKVALNNSFVVGKTAKTMSGSLRLIKTYSGAKPTTKTPSTDGKGVVGAQKGQRNQQQSQTLALAIAIPITILGIALLVGMVFYYRKYKNLEKHYTNMSGIYRAQDDELNIVYPADMNEDPHDRELLQNDIKPTKKKRTQKDEEKVPLGDHDELAMV